MLKITKKKLLCVLWMIYAMFSVLIVLYLADNLICKDMTKVSNRVFLEDNWNISINNNVYENVGLTDISFPAVKKDDKITMTTKIPEEWSYKESALTLHIRHTTAKVYVDDDIIFEYGMDRHQQGKTVGSGYRFVDFSDDYKGKELKIELNVTENDAFSSFDSIWISEWENTYRYILTENRLPFFIGAFLVVFGIMVTVISIFAVVISKKYMNVLLLSVFSICVGLWTLCYNNVTLIFSIPLYSISLMEYMSLYMAPLPILGYMYGYVKKANSKKISMLYNILFVAQSIFTVLSIGLHTMDISHAANLLKCFLVLLAIHIVFFGYVFMRNSRKLFDDMKIYTIGLVVIFICILYELVYYIAERYLGFDVVEIKGSASVGIVVFLSLLILDLYKEIINKVMEEHEKALLIKKAYSDDLTQINNRAFCSELMERYDSEGDHEYTMFTFDLNGLKVANDTYGHAKGDNLIVQAARVISEVFSPYGIVGRMGGDEFIAIIDTIDEIEIKKIEVAFTDAIKEKNASIADLNLSIAYGYARSSEVEIGGTRKVYNLADSRMYSCKKQQKQKRA